jgi:flagellar motor component MotA
MIIEYLWKEEKTMNTDDFAKEYNALVARAFLLSDKVIREGLLAMEEMIDEDKYMQRDVFEYGIKLTVDGTDGEVINKILTNIVELETDKDKKLLKTMQKEAVLAILERWDAKLILMLLNSYVNIGVEEAMKKYNEI